MKYLRWSARDRSLAEMLLVYERSLNAVGIPSWIAQDPEREWVPDEVVDGAMAALEKHQAGLRRADVGEDGLAGLRVQIQEKPSRSALGGDVSEGEDEVGAEGLVLGELDGVAVPGGDAVEA